MERGGGWGISGVGEHVRDLPRLGPCRRARAWAATPSGYRVQGRSVVTLIAATDVTHITIAIY